MKKRFILASVALFASATCARAAEVCGTGGERPAGYVPVLLSNGRLTVFVDPTLSVPEASAADRKSRFSPGVFWEGRRLGDNEGTASRAGWRLLPQGRFKTILSFDGQPPSAPERWRQQLDVRRALTTVDSTYPGGVTFSGEAFVPQARNAVLLRQSVRAGAQPVRVRVGLAYDAPRHERIVGAWKTTADGAQWTMTAYGRFVTHETIALAALEPDADVAASVTGGVASVTRTLKLAAGETRTLDWVISYADDLAQSLPAVTPAPTATGPVGSYADARAAHIVDWAAYFAEGMVEMPDPRLRALHDMARYHLRCVTTEWSIPVGILDSHWDGKIFAFDEMYAVQGLLSAGHFASAKVAADYRAATLDDACLRNSKDATRHGARWVWQAIEGEKIEGARLGFWSDHIFHQAAIAQTMWTFFRYTDDLAYLKAKGYPVLRECAAFFRELQVIDLPDGTSFVQKCTDLERLGPGRDHAFMTTCGVISTLRAAADAADLLGTDAARAADFRVCANRLVASLPVSEGRYIAYPGCTDESMGTLAGLFPFRTFGRDNAAQMNAVRHFLDSGTSFGNMYETGRRICPWYAATMAMAALRAGDDRHPPVRWLQEAARSAGLWGEYWEINEPGVSLFRPWFMTAAGNCLYAFDQLFVADREGAIYLAAGVPDEWRDYAFDLPAPGGLFVRMVVADGRLETLRVRVRHPAPNRMVKLVLPKTLGGGPLDCRLAEPEIVLFSKKEDAQ